MILVTGSNGFVGRALCQTLRARGMAVRGAVRARPGPDQVAVGAIDGATDWRAALAGCEAVIHLAARVHVMDERDADPLRAYREVNCAGSVNLARQASAAGVRRFVFVSSVKVNGEASGARALRADDVPAPRDPYGQSKLEAEIALAALSAREAMGLTIVRPPLIYGPGVGANFRALMALAGRGWPLPLGRARARRSMVALDNLTDLLALCLHHPAAPGQVLMVSDGVDLTVAELVRLMAGAMGKRVRLLPVAPALIAAAAGLVGKRAVTDRLFGALEVDIAHTKATLQWEPLVTPQAAIEKTVAHFLAEKKLIR